MNKKFSTTCSYCGVGCGIDITLSHNKKILSLEGSKENPVNKGMLCSKGINLHYTVNDTSDRLLKPQARFAKSYPLQEVDWNLAINRGASVFKTMIEKYGANSVGLYVSGQMLTEEYYLANKLCKGFFGTNNIDTNSRLCMSSAVVSYKKSIGDDAPPISYSDIEECDCFLIAGANPAWCHPILFRRIEAQLKNKNSYLIVVDPRETETACMADLHLKIKAGTDVALYNAIAALLFKNSYIDRKFLNQHTNGAKEIEEFLHSIDIEESAKICAINKKEIVRACDMIGKSKTLLTMWAMGLNQSSFGVDKNLALINLNLITGRIGKAGCGPFSLTGQPNAMGGREVGGLANLLAAHHDLANPQDRKKVADFWQSKEISASSGLTATEMIDAIEEDKLKALWIVCTNPAVSLPNLKQVKKAFSKIPFLMVSEISNKSDTLKYADLILPAAGWLEKEGTMTNSERRISYLPKAVNPPGEALPDSEIFCRFAKAMGFEKQFSYSSSEEVFNEHRSLTKGTNIDITGITYEKLKKKSIQWPYPSKQNQGTVRLFENKQFFTPNKKASLHCIKYAETKEKITKQFPFILTTGRLRDQWHTMTRTGKVNRLSLHSPYPFLEMNTIDAKTLSIKENELVAVFNARGSIEVKVKVSNSIKEGTFFLPMHWQSNFNLGKTCANSLTSKLIDPVSKEPEFKFSAVNIKKIKRKSKKIVVIGAGAASLEFIQKYRENNKTDTLVVFGKEIHNFYNRIFLPKYLSGKYDWDNIESATQERLKEQNIIFHKGTKVENIDKEKKLIYTSKGSVENYDKLVIATGSSPSIPLIPNIKGVFTLRSLDDADRIFDYTKKHKTAVVVGGGLLGLELADSLASLGIKVTIIQRSAQLMRAQIDELGGKILHEEITKRGIEVIYNEEIVDIVGEEAVEYVTLRSRRKVLYCKSLFFAVGIKPNVKLALKCGLKCSRGIIVNDFMQTSNENIYAIGEVAEHKASNYGTTAAAQEQAQILVNVLLGDYSKNYRGSINFNILKVESINLCSIGRIIAEDDSYEEVKIVDLKLGFYKKCLIKNDRLVGAILIGDKTEFSQFKNLIEQGYELGELRPQLLRGITKKIEPLGRLVCVCNNVGEGNIMNLIKKGCTDFEQICSKSNAGTGCGSCRPEVKKILDKAHSYV